MHAVLNVMGLRRCVMENVLAKVDHVQTRQVFMKTESLGHVLMAAINVGVAMEKFLVQGRVVTTSQSKFHSSQETAGTRRMGLNAIPFVVHYIVVKDIVRMDIVIIQE